MRKNMLYSFLLFVLLQCHNGHAIKCYFCLGECTVDVKQVDCAPDQHCMLRELKIPHKRIEQQKGCLSANMCNLTIPDPTLTQYCCNTDLCNDAIPSSTTTVIVPTTNASTSSSPSTTNATNAVIRPPGSPLMCYSCDYVCMHRSTVVCEAEQVCVTSNKKAVGIPLKKFGCANKTICSTNTLETVAGTTISIYNECCDNNLCNSAATTRFAVLSAFGAALVLWLTRLS